MVLFNCLPLLVTIFFCSFFGESLVLLILLYLTYTLIWVEFSVISLYKYLNLICSNHFSLIAFTSHNLLFTNSCGKTASTASNYNLQWSFHSKKTLNDSIKLVDFFYRLTLYVKLNLWGKLLSKVIQLIPKNFLHVSLWLIFMRFIRSSIGLIYVNLWWHMN